MRLAAGPWSLELAPERGASLTLLQHRGRDLLAAQGAFWMLPWCNRLDGGRFPWNGKTYDLPVNEAAGNALHGLGRDAPWTVEQASDQDVVLVQSLSRPPFHYAARLQVTLGEAGLAMALSLRNMGAEPCPMGLGWHPWFARPAGCSVHLRAGSAFRTDARSLPVEAFSTPGLDGGESEWLGIDRHFAGWTGEAALRRPDLSLHLAAEGDWAGNLQFFAPEDRPVICLEPVSHVPDVINRPHFAALGSMRVLEPGEAMAGRLVLTVRG
jgi:aldose 1-epimerase